SSFALLVPMNRIASRTGAALSVGAQALGSFALGGLAVGALALGAVAIGRLGIRRARIRRVEIDELVVRKLRVTEDLSTPDRSMTFVPERTMVYQETFVQRDQHRIYVRDHPGAEPAIILMHGFPDNVHQRHQNNGRPVRAHAARHLLRRKPDRAGVARDDRQSERSATQARL